MSKSKPNGKQTSSNEIPKNQSVEPAQVSNSSNSPIGEYNPSFADALISKSFNFCLYLLVLLTPLIILSFMSESALTPKFFLSQVLLIIIISLGIIRLSKDGIAKSKLSLVNIIALAFVFFYFIPSLLHGPSLLSFHEGMTMVLWVGGFTFISLYCRGDKAISRIILFIVLGGGLAAIYGILQYLNLDFLHLQWFGRKMEGKDIMISTFGNANFFAAYLVPITLIILSWWVVYSKNTLFRFLGILSIILLLGCIALSGVRAAWVELPVSLVIGLYFAIRYCTRSKESSANQKQNSKRFQILTWVIIVVILVTGFTLVLTKYQVYKPDWLQTQFKSLKDVHELESRFLLWQVSVQMIKEHPVFGVGVGRYQANFFQELRQFIDSDKEGDYSATLNYIQGRNANHVHNDYLQMCTETGIVSISLFLLFLVVFYQSQIQAIRISRDNLWKIKHIGLLVSTVPFLIDALVSFPFYLPANGLIFWIFCGLCIAHLNVSTEESIVQTNSSARSEIIGYAIACVFFLVFIIPSVELAVSKYYYKEGLIALHPLKEQEAIDNFAKSAEWNPSYGNVHILLGKIYGVSGQLEKGIAQYTEAEKYGTDDITLYQDPAIFYYAMKDYKKSTELFEKILAVYPNEMVSHKQLGIIYSEYLPDKDKAIEHIEKYLSTSPTGKDVPWFQEKLNQLRKQ